MSDFAQFQRWHRARKEHRCNLCQQTIMPGDVYVVGVTLPGDGAYPIGGGDYEVVDWPFTVVKAHQKCHLEMMLGEL